MAVREYWMVQFTRGEDSATDQAKVLTDIRVTRLGNVAKGTRRVQGTRR